MTDFNDLGKILQEQGSQLAKIGIELSQTKFIVVPASMANQTMSFQEALAEVSKTKEAVCIVRVVKHIEKKQKYGIVRFKSSPLNGKTVLLGVKNPHGLIRCSDIEKKTRIDHIHESFIEKL